MSHTLPQDKKIILFDDICLICHAGVHFIMKRDTQDQFRFLAQQSPLGQVLCTQLGIDTSKITSVILYEPDKTYYLKAQAIIHILASLGGFYSLIKIAMLIPTPISNAFYNVIAKKRYTWFGKKRSCSLLPPELRNKFL